MNEKIEVPVQLLNAIIAYLGDRPYKEVYQLVNAIQDTAKDKPKQGEANV